MYNRPHQFRGQMT